MDKIKEKLEKLRIESDTNLARAEKAEGEVKSLKETISKQESSVQTLNNKVSLLAGDLERAEKRADEHKQKKAESDNSDAVKENLERKIQLLEKQLDDKERDRKEATEKTRELSIVAEKHERKAKQLEAEKSDLERQLADSAAKYATVKAELDQTLKDLEGFHGHLTEHSLDNITFSNSRWAYSLQEPEGYRVPAGLTESTREILEKHGIPLHVTKHLQEFQRYSLQYKNEIEATEKEMYGCIEGDVDLHKAAQFMFKVQDPTPAEKLAVNEILAKGNCYHMKITRDKTNPVFIKRDAEQVKFIEECLEAMQSRDNRNTNLMKFLNKIKPVILGFRKQEIITVDWTLEDLQAIDFIKEYLKIGPNQSAVEIKIVCVGIVKKLALYSFYPSQQDAIKLLKEIGVFTPYEDLSLYQYNPKGFVEHLEHITLVGDAVSGEAKNEADILIQSGKYNYKNNTSEKSTTADLKAKPDSESQKIKQYKQNIIASEFQPTSYPKNDPVEKMRHAVTERVYTIDEPTAHELDDGVSLEESVDGLWIHVHIADPTAYMLPGNKLADLAQLRSTSIYLPHIHFPMMPDILSDKLFNLGKSPCALTFSAKLDSNGEIIDYKITPSILENVKITHYSKVDKALKGEEEASFDSRDVSTLKKLHGLTTRHRGQRIRNGAMIPDQIDLSIKVDKEPLNISLRDSKTNFSTPGHFDKNTITVKTKSSVRSPSNQLVSESMIIAGIVASKFCHERSIATAYRHQPNVLDYLKENGHSNFVPQVEQILNNIRNSVDPATGIIPLSVYEPILNYMPPANMVLKPLGHFSMGISGASNGYVKCTSPLRRYQDMLVHWQIKSSLLNEKQPFTEHQVQEITDRMNDIANRVKSLNKRSNRYWLLEFIRRKCFNCAVDDKAHSVQGRHSIEPYVNDGSGEYFKGIVVGSLGNGNAIVNLPQFGSFRTRCLTNEPLAINSEINVSVEKVVPEIGFCLLST
ncbi:hypothetical protein HDV01_004887 [Terramyces sp. JEL0728]|nr:hypothetical protein HDV01_004887 [Terramyces sp. JEL0728]